MKKNKIIIGSIVVAFLAILTLAFNFFYINDFMKSSGISTEGINLPIGYTLSDYTITERTGPKCDFNSDCTLPSNYAIRSSCPYVSVCLQNTCTVICPEHN